MNDFRESFLSPSATDWPEVALRAVQSPSTPVECPACHAQTLSAAWNLVNLFSREAAIDLVCASCGATQSLAIALLGEVPDFFPLERMAVFATAVKEQADALAERIRQHCGTMPALTFTTHPLWAEARWSATTFRWHPTSDAPPIMGLVFDDATPGEEIFREAKRQMNHSDRFEEIRVSIIQGPVPGQEHRPGYSVHIAPDPDALAMHATAEDFVLDARIVPLLGQWNRLYPVPGMPPMLPKFKQEFAKHKEFLLAPAVRRQDGQLWLEPELGIIKNIIHFPHLSEITPNDPDAVALILPQLITLPPT
ncbi:MAG: hypothetical protein NTU53_13625 [Planctomycetota bacterium]|nr:hypothetical protein [Planctomycetota bacterium]